VLVRSFLVVYTVLGIAALMHFICYLVVCLVLLAYILAEMLLQVSTGCWLGSLWSRLLHWCWCSLSFMPVQVQATAYSASCCLGYAFDFAHVC
jgi:hypothetical protein